MSSGSFVILESRGILRVSGRDASSFIQGYITSDVNTLAGTNWQAGAFCNLQGRMVSNFRMIEHAGELLISMDKALVETTRLFLKKYIVFSKAQTSDVTDDYRLVGVLGVEGQAVIHTIFGIAPGGETGCTQVGEDFILTVPGEVPRHELWLKSSTADAVVTKLAEELMRAKPDVWTLAEIRAGWPWLSPQTSEHYIPQMMNLQAQDAISFKKGCYLGQEIVARMQYLGQLKRRMYRLSVDAPTKPLVGDKLYNADHRAVGEIVMVAGNEAGFEVLAVTKEPDDQVLSLESGTAMEIMTLPYHCVMS